MKAPEIDLDTTQYMANIRETMLKGGPSDKQKEVINKLDELILIELNKTQTTEQ